MSNAITTEPNNITFQTDVISKKLTDTVNNLNNVAKDKYNKKNEIIESASDLSTSEKLEAIDRNFAQYVREEYTSIVIFTFLSISILGITAVSPTVIKSFKKKIA
ncbi:MAG: hypothetical protein PHE06_04640 [Lachnospiraceae bacterium]|nr:hypothetical protein [Lachnospiraceae bacterium]